jgi:hypothetical protein
MSEEKSNLNISEAARLVGVSRTTFYKHIKEKGITVQEEDEGNKVIDVAELMRAYNGRLKGKPPGQDESSDNDGGQEDVSGEQANGQMLTPRTAPKTPEIEQILRERIGDLEKQVQDLRQDKEKLHGIIENQQETIAKQQTLLLPAPQSAPATTQNRGFFARLFGVGN